MHLIDGFTRLWPTLGLAVAHLSAFGLLALAVRQIPGVVVLNLGGAH
ncbi:hypothetical protein [Micromonospora sp. RTP1Z1]|nr:hypothetical protein [Micromonospora sp. RTP1Z1]